VAGGAHQDLERVLGGDLGELDGDVLIAQVRVEEDVDPVRLAERAVDVEDRDRLREVERDRLLLARV